MSDTIKQAELSPLGKSSDYVQAYDRSLLFPIPRIGKREEIGIDELPFSGVDIWNAYELSWLNQKGKPCVAIAEFVIPCESDNIIESKSFKLYLNSFNHSRFVSANEVRDILQQDISQAVVSDVKVNLYTPEQFDSLKLDTVMGDCIDELDIDVSQYQPAPDLLETHDDVVHETIHSNILKSNCLVTGQPDWATVIIRYHGPRICHASLLKYLISFRNHNEFHEQCVERIFVDIERRCQPEKLSVYARYTRRGGLDINPFRSNFEAPYGNGRLARQ